MPFPSRVQDAPRGVRLTRRGRAAVVLLLAVLAFLAFSAGRASAGASGDVPPPMVQVTVGPGETLWGVAERVAPGADPRETVAWLVEVNGVTPQSLRPGQRLAVPARA